MPEKGPSKAKKATPKPAPGSEHVDKLHARIRELEKQVGEQDVKLATARTSLSLKDTNYQKLRAFVVERYGLGVLDVFDSLP